MKSTHRIVAPLICAAILVALSVTASFWAFRQTQVAANARKQATAVLSRADDLLGEMRDVEAGHRGYLLTGDDAFFELYLNASERTAAHLKTLSALTSIESARQHIDTVTPLVSAKLAELSRIIQLRRSNEITSAQIRAAEVQGKQASETIRTEMRGFIAIEANALAQHEAKFQANMRSLFVVIVIASIFTLFLAISSAYLVYRETQHRLKNANHLQTKGLLSEQTAANEQLQYANRTLQLSEEKLAVTLNSIGDAVITTDANAVITLLNPHGERLTGWSQAEACGRRVDEVFRVINKDTRLAAVVPVIETLAHGTIQGLANHTVLIARNGAECDIADSCAPIRNREGEVIGAVLVFRNVTGEYAAQQALRDSTARIQTILNTVVDGIVTLRASDGVVETANPAAERMFGLTGAELIGQKFSVLIPELDRDHSSGAGLLDDYTASVEARAAGQMREVVGRHKNGSCFPVEIAASEMWLGSQRYVTGILRDITARKKAEAALLEAGGLQNAIFNSANFSSIATDEKGVIQIFNVGAERMLGYSAADVLNKITPADISDPTEVIARAQSLSEELATPIAPGFEALVFKASRTIEDIYELTYIRKDGSRFPAVVSVTALRNAQDVIIGYLLIGIDNTARKRVEAERALLDQALQNKNIELENAKSIAEKANLAKTDFLSSMSHELRTPLNAILGFAQLMESGSPLPTASQQRSIHQILQAGWYLLELINEILDLALIESGKLSLSMEAMSLSAVMSECQAMIEPQARKRGINITFPRLDIPYFVKADRTRVKQVLINLLSNAIKYNKTNGTVEVDCIVARGHIRIRVTDTGNGLSPEKVEQLFQPFNRLGQEASIEEGTGIGLVVCKRLIEWMGGTIGVTSAVGTGSAFWIELNLTAEPQSLPTSPLAIALTQVPAHAQMRTLLYVEDNPANLMLVEDLIARRPDIQLLTAKDGTTGVEIACRSLPDVILMDINLPGISGIAALRILSDHVATTHIPVVALSANAMPRDIEKGLEAGFFRYLTKPIKVQEFMDTLDTALKHAATRSSNLLAAQALATHSQTTPAEIAP